MKTAIAATLVTTFLAVVLARWAVRGGRAAQAVVLGIAGLSLATPGLVLSVGHLAGNWARLDGAVLAVLSLAGRFLPYGLLAAWLALREVPRGQEEAAAVLGAGAAERATRVWLPLAGRGILAGALLVFLLALREIDAVVLIEPQIFPLRLYDKVHYSRLADEANLTILYLGHLLVPAVLVALVARRSRQAAPERRSYRGLPEDSP
jgi:iron(III) transport system permease protein